MRSPTRPAGPAQASERHIARLIRRNEEPAHQLFGPRFVKRDIQLVTLKRLNSAIAEFRVENSVINGMGADGLSVDHHRPTFLGLREGPRTGVGLQTPPSGRVVDIRLGGTFSDIAFDTATHCTGLRLRHARGPKAATIQARWGQNFNVLFRQFVNKPRWKRGLPLTIDAPIGGETNGADFFGARDTDVGQTPLFL